MPVAYAHTPFTGGCPFAHKPPPVPARNPSLLRKFHTVLWVKWYKTAKRRPCTTALCSRGPFFGRDSTTPGVSSTKRAATNSVIPTLKCIIILTD